MKWIVLFFYITNCIFQVDGIEAQGGFQYTGDDGQVYSISYAAGANGFQPQGAHLPVPPPTPEAILKALEQNARDEAAGIIDDGLYSNHWNKTHKNNLSHWTIWY